MPSQQRAYAIGSGVVDPKENEDGEGQQGVERYYTIVGGGKSQHIQHREGKGYVHLRQHSIGPVLNGVWMFQVKLGNQQVENGNQIGDEDHRLGCTAIKVATEIGHGKEEIDAGHGGDETVDIHILPFIDQSCKFPDGQSGDNAEQEYHSFRSEKRSHDGCHENDTCDGTHNKVLHIFSYLVSSFSACSWLSG